MTINGLPLPLVLVEALRSGRLKRRRGSWQLRAELDAFGNRLETELGEVYHSQNQIKRESKDLTSGFEPSETYGSPSPEMAGPGAIPDIVDFSKIVCFAVSGDGAPVCLDYRESIEQPRVIWWDDAYWRVIAPDIDRFLALFEIDSPRRDLSADPEKEAFADKLAEYRMRLTAVHSRVPCYKAQQKTEYEPGAI